MASDPREQWLMEPLLSLAKHVEWHRANGVDPVSGLLPPHAQLCAELVAHAMMRAGGAATADGGRRRRI